jgi:hypothetical protein
MATAGGKVKVRAYSPGRYPILVVELTGGELRTVYFETDYALEHAKQVVENWLRENAIGRHSFIEVSPPREVSAVALREYVNRELLG